MQGKSGDSFANLFIGFIIFMFAVCVMGIGIDKVFGFWDRIAAVIVLLIVFSAMLAASGLSCTFSVPRFFLSGPNNLLEAKDALSCMSIGAVSSFVGGVLTACIGLINVTGGGIDKDNLEWLGQGFAISIVTAFYGSCLAIFFAVGYVRMQRAISRMECAQKSSSESGECLVKESNE